MPSLAGQQELGQLQAGQGAAESLGQHPPGECWCCGAWRMQAYCQLLSHPVHPQAGARGAGSAAHSPLQATWGLLLFRREGLKGWTKHFQGSSESGWFSPKFPWDKGHYQTIPGHCTKTRKANTLTAAGSILQTLPGSLSQNLVGCFLLPPLCCVSGCVRLQKVQSICPFLLECPLSAFLKMFFRSWPSWKLCLIFPITQKPLVRFLVCKVHSVCSWVGQTLPATSHPLFKWPLYNTEVERVVTQRFRDYQ